MKRPPHRPKTPVQRTLKALAAVGAVLVVGALTAPRAASALPPLCADADSPLIISEIQLGAGEQPRWVELHNVSDEPVALTKVSLTVTTGMKGPAYPFALGAVGKPLPAGAFLVVGHAPPGKGNSAGAGLPPGALDLGANFTLASCGVSLALQSSTALLDSVGLSGGAVGDVGLCALQSAHGGDGWSFDGLGGKAKPGCANDEPLQWCKAGGEMALTPSTPGEANAPCDHDGDGKVPPLDCDDTDPAIHPGAQELCNGLDDNCDGQTDEEVQVPAGTCLNLGICAVSDGGASVATCAGSEGFVCNYPTGYEPIEETLCDGFDNDCDGETDEFLRNDCGGCGALPVEVCNGEDDDCDGQTDEDLSLDPAACTGSGVCEAAIAVCLGAEGPGCAMPEPHQVTETLCDGLDNDCDGDTDEQLGLGLACVAGQGACGVSGVFVCGDDGAVVCDAEPTEPAEVERCGDGVDNDCDGETDEGYDVGVQCDVGEGVCRVSGKQVCADDGLSTVCSVKAPLPAGPEACGNALDDDCDGQTDESGCGSVDSGCTAGAAGPPGAASNSAGPLALLALLSLVALLTRVRARLA